jgi:hypothetical protein
VPDGAQDKEEGERDERYQEPRPHCLTALCRRAGEARFGCLFGHRTQREYVAVSSVSPIALARTLKEMKAAVASLGTSSFGTFSAKRRK